MTPLDTVFTPDADCVNVPVAARNEPVMLYPAAVPVNDRSLMIVGLATVTVRFAVGAMNCALSPLSGIPATPLSVPETNAQLPAVFQAPSVTPVQVNVAIKARSSKLSKNARRRCLLLRVRDFAGAGRSLRNFIRHSESNRTKVADGTRKGGPARARTRKTHQADRIWT